MEKDSSILFTWITTLCRFCTLLFGGMYYVSENCQVPASKVFKMASNTIAAMPTMLIMYVCRLQILVGLEFGQSIPTVVRELQL